MTSVVFSSIRWLAATSLLIAGVAVAQPQTLRAAGITVSAERLSNPTDAALAFEVIFDTHADDLLAFDLAASAALERGAGPPIPGTFTYHPQSDGGHHRRGELRFVAAVDADLTLPFDLVLRDVGVPEWRFRWEATGAGAAATRPTPEAVPSVPLEGSVASSVMYVAVIGDGAVAAIDTTTFDRLWTLLVSEGTDARPPESAMGLALSPDGRTLYTGDAATGELVVVDTERREIVARVALDHGIHAIDLAPDGRELWLDGALEGYPWLSATSVVDTASLEIVRRLAPALGRAAHLRFTPDGREVWAPSVSTNLTWVWDATTGAVLAAIPLTTTVLVGDSPEGAQGLIGFNEIAMAPDGRTAYAVGPEAARVHAIDVVRREVTSTAQAGARAHGIAVRPDGREVWTANRSGSVTIFDAATLEELATLDLGSYANHVSFTRDGAFALVSRDTDVAVIDVTERTIVRLVEVGSAPHEFAGEPTTGAAATAAGR